METNARGEINTNREHREDLVIHMTVEVHINKYDKLTPMNDLTIRDVKDIVQETLARILVEHYSKEKPQVNTCTCVSIIKKQG